MSAESKIEWTDATWNPTVGCSIVSPGCTNCYAMKTAHSLERRFASKKYAGLTKAVNGNAVWTGEVRLDEDALLQPLHWKKPKRIFVNSMSDLFHESLPDDVIDRVFAVMALCPQHTFQVLTKRAERMRQWFAVDRADCVGLAMLTLVDRIPHGHRRVPWPLPNVWLGVSCERQQEADQRIPLLLETPAAIRFISAEPLLGPIDLTAIEAPDKVAGERWTFNALTDGDYYHQHSDLGHTGGGDGPYREHKIDWAIAGGESGLGARPMHPGWARKIRDDCAAAGVPMFFKQWGEYSPCTTINVCRSEHALCGLMGAAPKVERDWPRALEFLQKTKGIEGTATMARVGKKAAGRLLDGKEHNEFPGLLPSALAGTQNKTAGAA